MEEMKNENKQFDYPLILGLSDAWRTLGSLHGTPLYSITEKIDRMLPAKQDMSLLEYEKYKVLLMAFKMGNIF